MSMFFPFTRPNTKWIEILNIDDGHYSYGLFLYIYCTCEKKKTDMSIEIFALKKIKNEKKSLKSQKQFSSKEKCW